MAAIDPVLCQRMTRDFQHSIRHLRLDHPPQQML
jgi:hypothetical protein